MLLAWLKKRGARKTTALKSNASVAFSGGEALIEEMVASRSPACQSSYKVEQAGFLAVGVAVGLALCWPVGMASVLAVGPAVGFVCGWLLGWLLLACWPVELAVGLAVGLAVWLAVCWPHAGGLETKLEFDLWPPAASRNETWLPEGL